MLPPTAELWLDNEPLTLKLRHSLAFCRTCERQPNAQLLLFYDRELFITDVDVLVGWENVSEMERHFQMMIILYLKQFFAY